MSRSYDNRGIGGNRGIRGHVPPPVSRSRRQQTVDSSPVSGDASSVHRYTSGRRVIYRGGHIGHQHLRLITDHEDVGYDRESDDEDDNDNGDDTPHDASQRDSTYGVGALGQSQRPPIEIVGESFGSFNVHQSIYTILREHLKGPWITFRQVPKDVPAKMFDKFKTRWSWDPECEESIRGVFLNMLKSRYRDIIYNLKVQSCKKARIAGCEIAEKDFKQFSIIRNFPPDLVAQNVWGQMCDVWDTERWRKKSESGKSNRSSIDSGGQSSRHTGGSIGYDQYRARLRRVLGREPTYKEVFLITHLTKQCKERLLKGELNVNSLEGMVFCTDRAKQAYTDYLLVMTERHGPNFSEDDPDVWSRVVAKGRTKRVFGIGSSDLNYVVTGKPSSYGVTPSYTEQQQSQQKIHDLEAQMEVERRTREEMEEKLRHEIQQQMNEEIQRRVLEAMRNWQPPHP